MKKFITICLSALTMAICMTSCEQEVTPDPTAPARVIFNQSRQYLMTPVSVIDLACKFNEYYIAPTDRMREQIEDMYFVDYKIRFDTESQTWSLEHNNKPVVRIKMEGGKALNESGSKWSFLPGQKEFSANSEMTIAYKANGIYTVNFNNIAPYDSASNLLLSGSLEATPAKGSILLRGHYSLSSTGTLYKVNNRIGEQGLLVTPVNNETTTYSWYNLWRTFVNGSWVSTIQSSSPAETIAFTSIADYLWRIEYFAENGVHYLGYCNSDGDKITGPIEHELYY